VRVEDRERADPALAEPGGYLPERCGLPYPHRKRGHDVLDGPHPHHPADSSYAPSVVVLRRSQRQGRSSASGRPKVALSRRRRDGPRLGEVTAEPAGPVASNPADAWPPGICSYRPASSLALTLMAFTTPVAPAFATDRKAFARLRPTWQRPRFIHRTPAAPGTRHTAYYQHLLAGRAH
jgi:hypothetical protein